MDGREKTPNAGEVVKGLLELEGEKHQALINNDTAAFEDRVRAQNRLLSAFPKLKLNSDIPPDQLVALSRLIRLNIALVCNIVSVSPAPPIINNEYTSRGTAAISTGRLKTRVSYEA